MCIFKTPKPLRESFHVWCFRHKQRIFFLYKYFFFSLFLFKGKTEGNVSFPLPLFFLLILVVVVKRRSAVLCRIESTGSRPGHTRTHSHSFKCVCVCVWRFLDGGRERRRQPPLPKKFKRFIGKIHWENWRRCKVQTKYSTRTQTLSLCAWLEKQRVRQSLSIPTAGQH